MFNWFYWGINLGALSSLITTNVEKYHSFWLAYLIPLIVFNGSIVVLLVGRRRFIRSPPSGSLVVRAFSVFKLSVKNRWKIGISDDHQHILDYAKDSIKPLHWSDTASQLQFIEDLKQTIRVCRVFTFFPFYIICYNQMLSNLISQGAQMNVGEFFLCLCASK